MRWIMTNLTPGQRIAHDAIHEGLTEWELADDINSAIAVAVRPLVDAIEKLMEGSERDPQDKKWWVRAMPSVEALNAGREALAPYRKEDKQV